MTDPDRINRHDPQQREGLVHDKQALRRPTQAEAALQHHCEPSGMYMTIQPTRLPIN